MVSEKGELKMEMQKVQAEKEPCWKKKAADDGFFAKIKSHYEQFVNSPMDQHRICLKKTLNGVSSKFRKSGSMYGSKTEGDTVVKEESQKAVQSTQ